MDSAIVFESFIYFIAPFPHPNSTISASNHFCSSLTGFLYQDIKLWDDKRFVVVRDPLRRLLSAYRDKIEQLRETVFKKPAGVMMLHHRPIRWNMKFYRDKSTEQAINYAESMTENKVTTKPDASNPYLYPPYPTFKEFVSEIIAGWGNPHIVPATQYCGPCSSKK